MKSRVLIVLTLCLILSGCVSAGKHPPADYFTLFNDAVFTSADPGYHLIAPGEEALALRSGKVYSKKMVCEFSLLSPPGEGARNGFLVLYDSSNPETMIFAGVYIGAGEYSIHGPGVNEPILVPVNFDPDQEFQLTVLINFEKRFIELMAPGRTIGTGLAPHMRQVETIGFSANNTETFFSPVKITGE